MQPPEVRSRKSLTTFDACTYAQVNFLDLEEQGLYSRTSLVVDYDPHDHGDSFDAVMILIIRTIQLFEHPTFSRKNY